VSAEHGESVGALDELHGSRVAWVDLDGARRAAPGDEVDAVHADEPELLGDDARERSRGGLQ
jgi:hypothetical protein